MASSSKFRKLENPQTPEKDDSSDTTAIGYVHNVTPIKLSTRTNIPYFNCVLQTERSTFHDVVSFTPEKRNLFLQAADKKTPLKMTNVSKSLSFSPTSPNRTSLRCHRATILAEAAVNFPRNEPATYQSTVTTMPVKNVLTDAALGDHVCITAKIMDIDDQITNIQTKSGRNLPLKNCDVADISGSIRVSLWDTHIDQVNLHNSYMFDNLTVKDFDSKRYLSTTVKTTISNARDITEVAFDDKINQPTKVQGTPSLASVTISNACQGCSTKIDLAHSQMQSTQSYKCQSCKMRMKLSQCKKTCTVIIQFNNNPTRFSVYNDTVTKFLTSCNKLNLLNDADALEEFLIDNELILTLHSAESRNPKTIELA
ncbi:uncharacterized protein LOC117320249 [Pecten maximus]|uniref:uncharacterized protein LOC117320249 n=1 Tax=Pecten maximus TaxID=6579 RepID=UPI0014583836|nr:uncharacterized protein LOC117320249 [Pecten maximus]